MTNLMDDINLLAILGQAPMIQPQPDDLDRFVRQVWMLLDGVTTMAGDSIWADTETTAHEAFVEIVNEYRPELAAELAQELEA